MSETFFPNFVISFEIKAFKRYKKLAFSEKMLKNLAH